MDFDTLIVGAGAAGMMAAAHAGGRVLVIDHAKAPGEKIRISGGGRCNFTNLYTEPSRFLSQNPHFCKSALSRYTQWDFIDLVDQHKIAWHEKTLGQLFCDVSSKDIIAMLRTEMDRAGAELWLKTSVVEVAKRPEGFVITAEREGQRQRLTCQNLIIATGGKSIPKMGATGWAYQVAEQFDLPVIAPRPGLVPLTFSDDKFKPLAGVATPARITAGGTSFDEAMLFTHRGLSGPAVLQASSYWQIGEDITVNLLPEIDLAAQLKAERQKNGRKALGTVLSQTLPAKLVNHLSENMALSGNMGNQSDANIDALCDALSNWHLRPSGSEGYRTAEVTLGGVDTDALSSKTMQAKSVPGLYFIGEAVDVTGWLGGYNFQWAWSSGWAAGQAIQART